MATVKEIKEALAEIDSLDDVRWQAYEEDSRAGVQKAIIQRKKVIQADIDEDLRLENMLRYEKELYQAGYEAIGGIDEVGRGPLAGPVVTACVILPKNCKIKHLNDSKKIPKKHHEEIYEEVLARALGVDQIKGQVTKPDYLLIDAMHLDTDIPQQSLIKGDANSLSIAAASIVAKVTRDRMMADYAKEYPGYAFEKNVGYGTKDHLTGLKEHGITPIHRTTFEAIKSMLKEN